MKFRQGRPTIAEIDRSALRWNLAQVRARVKDDVTLMAVLKADAYGHGIAEVARVFEKEGVKAFGVATVEEGVAIRDAAVVHPEILVLAGFVNDQVEPIFQHRLTPLVCDLEMARLLAQRLRGSMRSQAVHVKADTGLGRLGVTLREMPAFLDEMRKIERLKIVGVCSHLGSATNVASEAIERQVQAFVRAGELCAIHGSPVKIRHLANSMATITRPDLHFEMVRPGLVLYGLVPEGGSASGIELRPAMRLKTRILGLRRLPAGHGVGYDQTFITVRDSVIATLPIGYADGYPRSLSNSGYVLVRGQRAPVVGRVCMDLTMIDVTGIEGVALGDEVVLWGKQQDDEIRVDEVAAWADTISYELLCAVGRRVPRTYVN
jgi:alanine racemase